MKKILLILLISFIYSQDCQFLDPDTSIYRGKNRVRVLPNPTGLKATVQNRTVKLTWNDYWKNNWDCYTAHFGVAPVPADFSLYRKKAEDFWVDAIAHTGWKVNEYTEQVPYGVYDYYLMATTDRHAEYMNWSKRVHIRVEVKQECVFIEWQPPTDTVEEGVLFLQTDNCGNTRNRYGTGTMLGIDDEEYWDAVKDYEEQTKTAWFGCSRKEMK